MTKIGKKFFRLRVGWMPIQDVYGIELLWKRLVPPEIRFDIYQHRMGIGVSAERLTETKMSWRKPFVVWRK